MIWVPTTFHGIPETAFCVDGRKFTISTLMIGLVKGAKHLHGELGHQETKRLEKVR